MVAQRGLQPLIECIQYAPRSIHHRPEEETLVRSLQPLERAPALSEQVYHKLRGHLRSGEIAGGQPLQEVPLAERLGVSRTPVREALTRLASEGLLVSDGRSFVVPAFTRQDVDDIYEVRFLIEPAAIKDIARLTRDKAARAPLEDALAEAAAAHKAGDALAFREANIAFRGAWLALVPNPRLVKVIEQYADHMQHIRAITLGDPSMRGIVLKGLRSILRALASGDGDAAAAATFVHLQNAKKCFLDAMGLHARPVE
ncbi:HTH-type transcriptional regulator McbR [Burkholderiales bacterium]|nr:HTH-type transcriptional regulator McbR [Burkholderiales bacterium]